MNECKRGVLLALAIASTSVACNADRVLSPVTEPTHEAQDLAVASRFQISASATVAAKIGFATYEGSGEAVHPDVVSFDNPWNGHRFWSVITPYPNSATQYENPSLFSSDDGDSWSVADGIKNPLTKTTRGYLSDPDMVYVPERDEMRLYYREVQNVRPLKASTHLADHVWLITSKDAQSWTAPRRVATDSGKFIVSPSIVRATDNTWRMYEVDAGTEGCSAKTSRLVMRRSPDGLSWTAPTAVNFTQSGFVPWHVDVEYVPSQGKYWALVAAYPAAQGCTNTSLFLATSVDGTNWVTYPAPVLARGELDQFSSAVYRSTFAFGSNNDVTIWYSGARVVKPASKKQALTLAWSTAVTHTTATELLAHVSDKLNAAPLSIAISAKGGGVAIGSTIVP